MTPAGRRRPLLGGMIDGRNAWSRVEQDAATVATNTDKLGLVFGFLPRLQQ